MQKYTNVKELRYVNSKIRYFKIFQVYPSALCVCAAGFWELHFCGNIQFLSFCGRSIGFPIQERQETSWHPKTLYRWYDDKTNSQT